MAMTDDEDRRERARLSRQQAEETLARLDAREDVAEPRDESAGSRWHFDPVQRNANWRNAPEPVAGDHRPTDAVWIGRLRAEIMGEVETRLTAERERNAAVLVELVAGGELGEAPKGLAEDLRQLREAVAEVSRSLAAFAAADRASKEAAVVDLPALPRRSMN
jgi:hypothetical protein